MANAATWFVDRHLEEGRGDKVAFREASRAKRSLTYGELAARSDQVAGAFGRAGIGREARAAMFVLDQIEFPQIFLGGVEGGRGAGAGEHASGYGCLCQHLAGQSGGDCFRVRSAGAGDHAGYCGL